ncbi:MAG: electron transport complex subunit RsxE [Firmicutes bacterium CAG:110_56_8]|nr:MAG: electron transport complex subunit RsxE [Firmicutes bacterium CAG:110_56_8]
MDFKKQFKEGLLTKNPVLVQLLGMCSTLAITTSLFNGIGMGLAVTVILICSNILISALRKVIPNQIRIAAYITIIAGFVTVVDLSIQAFLPALSQSLGVFIPLIVVNCIIFGRAEAFAFKNKPLASVVDGLGMGLGFTLAITLISSIREILGSGTFFGMQVMPESYLPMGILVKPAGGFIVLGLTLALMNKLLPKKA